MSAMTTALVQPVDGQLHHNIDCRGAFRVASGVPALVLFSIGGIAGMFPHKSDGASVYGATAWVSAT